MTQNVVTSRQELLRLRGVPPMSSEEALALTRRALDAFGLSKWYVRLTEFPPIADEIEVVAGVTFIRPGRRLGLCSYKRRAIELSRLHVERDRRDYVIETIAEEVAHALTPGDTNHGPRWKSAFENLKANIEADVQEQAVIRALKTGDRAKLQ
jgi:hypothetical protein